MWFYMWSESVASSVAAVVEPRAKECEKNEKKQSRRVQPWAALSLIVLLGAGALGCEDLRGERWGRDGRFGPGWSERGGFGRRGPDGFWHHRRGPGAEDGAASGDAGADAGAVDAGDAGALANSGGNGTPPAPVADAGVDAASVPSPVVDAGAASEVAALGDDQLVLLADSLLAGELDRARTALPSLVDADVLAFAEQSGDALEAARATLATIADAIGVTPAASDVADAVRAESDSALEELVAPDAGGLDAVFLSSQLQAYSRSLELLPEMIAAADSPELSAQLVVLRALQQQDLSRIQALTAALGG
jgi:hypothetical protein